MVFETPHTYFKSIEGSQSVWITIINRGYVNYTRNFLKSMEINNVSFTLIIYCLDKDIASDLDGYKNIVCLDASYFIKGLLDPSLTHWGMLSYKSLVFSKLDALKYTQNLCKQYSIPVFGYIDTDIIVLKDPTQIILDIMSEYRDVDVFHQCDENIQLCSNKSRCPNICTGVIAFRTFTIMNEIFEYCSDDIVNNMSDQHYMMERINKLNIRRISIHKHIFLNGVYPNLNTTATLVLPETASLIHFNCMIGSEKEYNMKLKGMWYI